MYSYLGRKVIFIMVDSQRWDMVGCYADNGIKTPNLDRLAAEGIRYERAYDCQPVCGPARSAIFTGNFPHSNGAWANSIAPAMNWKTIGQRLQDQRFHTAYIGKWHLDGGDYFGLGECPDGWDPEYWYDMRNCLQELPDDETRYLSRQGKTAYEPGVTSAFTYAHRCTDRALDFVENHREEDYFLVVSYDEPHGPSLCPEPYASMYKDYAFPKAPNIWDELEAKPGYQKVWAGDRLAIDKDELELKSTLFLGCNSYVDSQIGRLLDSIDRYAPDALVIYTSDHGDAMLSHSLYAKGPSMYDEIARVPFIVRAPGGARGAVSPHPVSHIDIAPTILDYLGLPVPKLLDGKSLVETFTNPDKRINDYVFTEFSRYEIDHDGFGGFQPMRGVFDGRYKLSIHLESDDELYDMEEDPYELHNLIMSEEHKTIRNRLHDAILDWMNATRDPFRGYYWERRPWREDAREASWDYTGYTRQRENEEYEPRQLDYDTGLPMEKSSREKGFRSDPPAYLDEAKLNPKEKL